MPEEVSLWLPPRDFTALAIMALAPKNQARLDDLLKKNFEGKLSAEGTKELDLLRSRSESGPAVNPRLR
jgi:hypothetical protein